MPARQNQGPADSPGSRAALPRVDRAWRRVPRFVRNAAISGPTFGLDLGLLWLLVHLAHLGWLAATILAFLVANGLSYFLARWLVFHGARRGMKAGLVYFLVIAALSALAVILLMWLFVGAFHLGVVVSRVAAAIITGVGGYLSNLMLNFRVAPSHLSEKSDL